ncbi:hypothetical protein V1524DRAFT_442496 [Lipomyces starkeyi]
MESGLDWRRRWQTSVTPENVHAAGGTVERNHLTSKLWEGRNVLGAHVGNGLYAGVQGDRFFWPSYEDNTFVRYGNELCFFAELHLSTEMASIPL